MYRFLCNPLFIVIQLLVSQEISGTFHYGLSISDLCFAITERTKCCVSKLKCDETGGVELYSRYDFPTTFYFQAKGHQTECSGQWEYNGEIGEVTMLFADLDMSTTLSIGNSTNNPPFAEFTSCNVEIAPTTVAFHGNMSTTPHLPLTTALLHGLQWELPPFLCNDMVPYVGDILSEIWSMSWERLGHVSQVGDGSSMQHKNHSLETTAQVREEGLESLQEECMRDTLRESLHVSDTEAVEMVEALLMISSDRKARWDGGEGLDIRHMQGGGSGEAHMSELLRDVVRHCGRLGGGQMLHGGSESVTAGEGGVRQDDGIGDDISTPTDDCTGPVQCALNGIVIGPLDDLCVDLQQHDGQICVRALSCFDIAVETILSGNPAATSLTVGVEALALTCSADWSIMGEWDSGKGKGWDYEGSVMMRVSNFSGSLDGVFGSTTEKNQYPPIPESVKIENCVTSGTRIDIQFDGGVIGSLLNRVVAPPLEDLLESAVYWALCDIIDPFLARLVTGLLQEQIDPEIERIIDMSTPPPPVQMPDYLAWSETFVGTIHTVLDLLQVNEGQVLRCMLGSRQTAVVPGYDLPSLIDYLTDGTGEFNIPIGKTFSIGDATLEIERLVIAGLDTFHDVFLLQPSPQSAVTLQSSLGVESMDMQLFVLLTSQGDTSYEQEAIIDLLLTNVTLAFDLVAALKLSVLDGLFMDQVLNLACLESALDALYVSSLEVLMDMDHLTIQQISGGDATSLEEDTAQLINSLFTLLLSGYPDMTTDIIAGIAQGPIKAKINDKLLELVESYEQKYGESCPQHVNYTTVNWMEWESSAVINKVDTFFNTLLGPKGINRAINCVTGDTGTVTFTLSPTSPIFAEWTVTLSGLNSFFDFALVYPILDEPFDLGSLLGLGKCASPNSTTGCTPAVLTLQGIENDIPVHVSFSLVNLSVYVDMLVEWDTYAMKSLTWAQYKTTGCVMSTMDALSVSAMQLAVSDAKFFFLNETAEVSVMGIVQRVFDALTSTATLDSLNNALNTVLLDSNSKCDGSYNPIEGDDDKNRRNFFSLISWQWKLSILCVSCVLAMSLLFWNFYRIDAKSALLSVKDMKTMYGYTLLVDKDMPSSGQGGDTLNAATFDSDLEKDGMVGCVMSDVREDNKSEHYGFLSNAWFRRQISFLCNCSLESVQYDAIIANDQLSPLVRLAVLLIILILFGLFLISDMHAATIVMAEIDLGDQVITPDPIFEFAMAGTVKDMWEAKTYYLAILIAFFTGAWPFVKLFLMLLAWVLPTSIMSMKHRDSTLIWMDILGKWSLVDTFVMVSVHLS